MKNHKEHDNKKITKELRSKEVVEVDVKHGAYRPRMSAAKSED